MPKSSFSASAGSGINRSVNNVIYVKDKGNQDITGYANIYGDLNIYDQKKEAQIAYLYVKFDSESYADYEYIYLFRTLDGGITREVIPLTLIGNTLSLFVGDPGNGIPNVSYSRYRSGLGAGNAYANTTPPTYNASFIYDNLYTYYVCIFTASDTLNLDFQAYVSTSADASGFSYINLLPNQNDEGNDVTWEINIDTSAWTRETLTAPSTISDISNYTTPSVVFSVASSDGSTNVSGSMIVSGDLTVNGTTTTINTTNLSVEDTIIEINRNGTLSVDMGILFNKSTSPKPVFYWNSLYNNRFDLATASGVTSTSTNLHSLTQTPTGLNMGALTATTGSFSSTLGVTGVTTLNNNLAINWSSGVSRTFQILKTGSLSPHFYVDNSGNVLFGTAGATFQTLANIDASYGTSSFYTTNFDSGVVTYKNEAKIKVNKYTSADTPFITLNADRTGASQEADVRIIEVERGTLSNSYLKWDETNNWWYFSNILVAGQIHNDTFNGVQATLNYGAGQADEDIVLTIKDQSNNDSLTLNAGGDLFTSGIIEMDKPTLTTTPAITLNADCIGPGTESSVIALSVVRAEEVNSYLKWNESTDTWEMSNNTSISENLDVGGNLTATGGDAEISNLNVTGSFTASSTFIGKPVTISSVGTINLASGNIFHLIGSSIYTVTLPDATTEGTIVHFKNVGTAQKTIDPIYIEGNNIHTIKLTQYQAITLYYNLTSWWVLSTYGNVTIN